MSVHARKGKWQVKWRADGGQRSRTFADEGDARAFDASIVRRKRAARRVRCAPHVTRTAPADDILITPAVRAYLAAFDRYLRAWRDGSAAAIAVAEYARCAAFADLMRG